MGTLSRLGSRFSTSGIFMTITSPARSVRVAKPNDVVASYATLLKQVRKEGLLSRKRGFYISIMVLLGLALGAAWTGFALLGDTWFQLLIAGALGVVMTQIAFLAHETLSPSWRRTPPKPRESRPGSPAARVTCSSRSSPSRA